jgi:hypothetical protein
MDEPIAPSMNKEFIKNFSNEGKLSDLPDSDYWLSREEIILTNLHLRGGAVPKVQIKNLIDKSLTLQNAGLSLDEYFFNPEFPKINDALGYHVFLLSTMKLKALFNLDTLHLDIALRNIASPSLITNEIYILDFIHALSEHNKLQKPLPLIPTHELHHPLLIQALELDWKNYFSAIGKPCPKLDKTLTISNQEFCDYWVSATQVQLLCKNLALLSHGIGNLALEFSRSLNLESNSRKLFQEIGLMMRNLDERDAEKTLQNVEIIVKEAMNNIYSSHFDLNNATPIPKVQKDSRSADTSSWDPKNHEIFPKSSKLIEQTLTSRETPNKDVLEQSKRRNLLLIFFLCWSLIGFNVYLIDVVVVYNKIILSNEIILLIIISGFIIPVALCLGIFQQEKINNIIQKISLALAVLTQFSIIVSYPTSTYNHIWTWLPSLVIGTTALLINHLQAKFYRMAINRKRTFGSH